MRVGLDELDKELLGEVAARPGSTIADIVRPFLTKRSRSALRDRVQMLYHNGLIVFDHHSLRGRVLCYPKTNAGKIEGQAGIRSSEEAQIP